MTNVPHPVIYVPTAASRAAALARMRAAGIHIAGEPGNYPLSGDWETAFGHAYHHIHYNLKDQGVHMGCFRLSVPSDLTLVNSVSQFISYVRRHKLPLSS